jgi:arsenate reductase (thioredoxin)
MLRTDLLRQLGSNSEKAAERSPPAFSGLYIFACANILSTLFYFRAVHSREVAFMKGRYNVLFLCTGNSARSIMAEAIMNKKGWPTFTAFSAGSHPTGRVNPHALNMLQIARLSVDGLRSKAWDEFAKPGAPDLHFVFTVCDNAAKEVCPVWPGQPMTAHWAVPDPASVVGTDEQIERAFRDAFNVLERRISLLLCLPLESLDKLAIQKEIDRIGKEMPEMKRSASE